MMRSWLRLLAMVGFVIPTLLPARTWSDPAYQLPDLVALRPVQLQIGPSDYPDVQGPAAIRFTTDSVNRGVYALEVLGMPTSTVSARAFQCVEWISRACASRVEIGALAWHWEHGHWHFEDYATYELRRVGSDGKPDESPEGLVESTGKVSFCLEDSGPDPEGWGASDDPTYGYPLYWDCKPVLQGISPGWMDEYGFGQEGQQVPLEGIDDGTYAVVLRVNPNHHILESSYDNNVSYSIIVISGGGTELDIPEG